MIRALKYKGILALVLTAGMMSCKKDYLELNPVTTVALEDAITNESTMKAALLGTYAGLRATDLFGRTAPILGDLIPDNIYVSTSNSGRYTAYNSHSYVVSDSYAEGLWAGAYTCIMRANNIINAGLDSTTNMKQYLGEAYAIRALGYFTLIRYFGKPYTADPTALGVPLVTLYNPDAKTARSTVAEIYTQIHSDLTQAYSLMTTFTNSSQFSKYAAKALEAKVYLTQGNYTDAKTAALDVINSSGFTLVDSTGYATYWTNATVRTDKVETLFEVSSDAVGNNSYDALSYIYSRSGYGDMLCSTDLYALYASTDVRKTLFTVSTRGGLAALYVNKYPAISGDRSDTKILRLSEMYLIVAEASYASDETLAKTYLNRITAQRKATAITSTGSQLFEDIITERRKELAFEGDRYMDLQRLQRNISRSSNYPSTALTLDFTHYRRLLPIPQTEINSNTAIASQQNPGYD